MNYEWPEELYPLRDWMKRKLVDVDSLKSDRQALWMAKELARQKNFNMPKRGQSAFQALMKLQAIVRPRGNVDPVPKKKGFYIDYKALPGTFGAASEVRRIDPSDYKPAPTKRSTP